MSPQIFLIAPSTMDMTSFPKALDAVLDSAPVAAFLLPENGLSDDEYAAIARTLLPIAQRHDCALLLQDRPALAKTIGADGVHITTGIADLHEALKLLKPDMIVGAKSGKSRHDAMTMGEADIDYLFFGTPVGAATPESADMAAWWAETFEVPAVFADPAAQSDLFDNHGCEFIGLGDNIWAAPEGAVHALQIAMHHLTSPQ